VESLEGLMEGEFSFLEFKLEISNTVSGQAHEQRNRRVGGRVFERDAWTLGDVQRNC
jgi:hypothetical protein